jgi:hypothetical protein
LGFFKPQHRNKRCFHLGFRFSDPQHYPDFETARQGYLRSYPVGTSVRASGVR